VPTTSREFNARLLRRARRAGVSLSSEVAAQLEAYYRLLELWNRKINLTGLPLEDAPDETLDRLLVEPLVAVREVPALSTSLIDLGTGGGSPAIPMRIAAPQLKLIMVEAKTRKSAFLREVVRQLPLKDATVETARFEELLSRPDLHEAVDVATIRAVRVEARVLTTVQAFLKPMGILLLFKAATSVEKPESITPPLEWMASRSLIESVGSRLVILRKSALPLSR
jgi:16S rRNA (guanine527-N7)-methyltransferase